jgi:rare lipoprotein A
MNKLFTALLFVLSFEASAYAQEKNKKENRKPATEHKEKATVKYGTASFYAKKFDGRRTADGEIFNSSKYTAACNVLPFGTWIKVTNLKNKRSVIVKINDRLHPKNKRLVDLSETAARQLGYYGRGLTRVKIEVLRNYHP